MIIPKSYNMRVLKKLTLLFSICLMLFSCNGNINNDQYKNEIQKYLIKNIELNQSGIKRLNNKRLILKEEKPKKSFPNFKFIDSLYSITKKSINSSIKNNTKLSPQTINNYKILKDTVFSLRSFYSQNEKKSIIDESIILNKTTNNNFNSLLYLNDTESVFYQYLEHIFYKPLSFAVCSFSNINVKCDISKDSTEIILSNPIIQKNPENRLIIIDRIKTSKVSQKANLDYSFAKIKIDRMAKGKHVIKGKIKYFEYGKEIYIPFEKEFEIK